MIKKLHPTLLEMWLVMLCYGVVMQAVILIVAKQRLYYSIGAWAGILSSLLLSGLMLRAITNLLDKEEKDAAAYSYKQYALRLMIVLAMFFVLAFFHAGSVVSAFFGLFSLKLSAYLQPYVHRLALTEKLCRNGKEGED